jgi:hypothetical protein
MGWLVTGDEVRNGKYEKYYALLFPAFHLMLGYGTGRIGIGLPVPVLLRTDLLLPHFAAAGRPALSIFSELM